MSCIACWAEQLIGGEDGDADYAAHVALYILAEAVKYPTTMDMRFKSLCSPHARQAYKVGADISPPHTKALDPRALDELTASLPLSTSVTHMQFEPDPFPTPPIPVSSLLTQIKRG